MLERFAGNAALRADLAAALAAGRLAHCLLLVGEPGCGAGFAARCLAADYLYPAGGPHAEAVLRAEDTECITLRGEGASGNIPVENVRKAREKIQRSALSDAAGRVMFIYAAENLNGPSANALLKLLEEPPEGVLFLLTASSAAAVLPTIRSRCACYTVAPVPQAECAAVLRRLQPLAGESQALELSFLYEGHIGTCLRALQDPQERTALENAKKLAAFAQGEDLYRAQAQLAALGKDKEAAGRLLRQLRSLGSAALRRPGFAGLSAPRAAQLIRAADAACAAMAANGNLRLLLTVFGAAAAGPLTN